MGKSLSSMETVSPIAALLGFATAWGSNPHGLSASPGVPFASVEGVDGVLSIGRAATLTVKRTSECVRRANVGVAQHDFVWIFSRRRSPSDCSSSKNTVAVVEFLNPLPVAVIVDPRVPLFLFNEIARPDMYQSPRHRRVRSSQHWSLLVETLTSQSRLVQLGS